MTHETPLNPDDNKVDLESINTVFVPNMCNDQSYVKLIVTSYMCALDNTTIMMYDSDERLIRSLDKESLPNTLLHLSVGGKSSPRGVLEHLVSTNKVEDIANIVVGSSYTPVGSKVTCAGYEFDVFDGVNSRNIISQNNSEYLRTRHFRKAKEPRRYDAVVFSLDDDAVDYHGMPINSKAYHDLGLTRKMFSPAF